MKKLLIAMLILSTMLLTSCGNVEIVDTTEIAEKADIIHYQKSGDLLYENATEVVLIDGTSTISFVCDGKRYYINNNYNVEVKK